MAYVGIASDTIFNITSLSPYDNNFSFHVCKHCQSLILISDRAFFSRFSNYRWETWIFLILLITFDTRQGHNLHLNTSIDILTKYHSYFLCINTLAQVLSILVQDIKQQFWRESVSLAKYDTIIHEENVVYRGISKTLMPFKLWLLADCLRRLTNPYVHDRKR